MYDTQQLLEEMPPKALSQILPKPPRSSLSSCHIKLEVLGLLSYSIAKLELGKSAFSGRSSLLNIASIISMHKVLIVNLSFWHRK
ncbi:hypothetical protein PVAP13_1KG495005 [Panicum virgatum]|uniref:Uncharacterized protein n=1 Tax=Panicum virgatum TaxID=38727 RepID=A0A8T0XVX4_PANVG|nr:hypothetical protein PVAP13_1KG495005 [Panicum virgatum]